MGKLQDLILINDINTKNSEVFNPGGERFANFDDLLQVLNTRVIPASPPPPRSMGNDTLIEDRPQMIEEQSAQGPANTQSKSQSVGSLEQGEVTVEREEQKQAKKKKKKAEKQSESVLPQKKAPPKPVKIVSNPKSQPPPSASDVIPPRVAMVEEQPRQVQQVKVPPSQMEEERPAGQAEPRVVIQEKNLFANLTTYLDKKFGTIENEIDGKLNERMRAWQSAERASLQATVEDIVRKEVGQAFSREVQPSIEKYLKIMTDQILSTYERGHKYYMDKLTLEQGKTTQMRDSFQSLIDSFSGIGKRLSESIVVHQQNLGKMESLFAERRTNVAGMSQQLQELLAAEQVILRSMETLEKNMTFALQNLNKSLAGLDNMSKDRKNVTEKKDMEEEAYENEQQDTGIQMRRQAPGIYDMGQHYQMQMPPPQIPQQPPQPDTTALLGLLTQVLTGNQGQRPPPPYGYPPQDQYNPYGANPQPANQMYYQQKRPFAPAPPPPPYPPYDQYPDHPGANSQYRPKGTAAGMPGQRGRGPNEGYDFSVVQPSGPGGKKGGDGQSQGTSDLKSPFGHLPGQGSKK
eukprot:TRINITY_DN3211_c0_g1_i2.p2 TRINITY_DN3211_c0_g1~~TRINITY_DN3211_c0_g1_i2.p2  ORF type:complete len:575 (+),score=162.90 TRINITY_DN3211_c0_g1_i2:102-1826(+)